ncbi:40696_t:CDS:1 [Gigaspora margarita]|uniref:Fucosyltransferase n=1 Tax=Gigaspora margarita TaxID=4874 RepID=A0ABM8W0R1_GIGMA|nr:40696_t:CDS:1 [Gigaspora margarita]
MPRIKLYLIHAIIAFLVVTLLLLTTQKRTTIILNNELSEISIDKLDDSLIMNNTKLLIDKLKIKPTSLIEWKQRHYITKYLNNNKKLKIYITYGSWYTNEDFLRLTYNFDGTLADCDIPCIWKQANYDIASSELETADALFNVDTSQSRETLREGQKTIKLTIEPKTHCSGCHYGNDLVDIYSSFDEDSDLPTSYVRDDPEIWRTIQPFDITKLSPNSTLVSFVASHMTEYRKTFIPSLQDHMSVASFGYVYQNTPWSHYPECLNLGKFETKNCVVSKYPFYLALESCQEKDYSTEKLWNTFKVGVVPIIWGAPNVRSYLPHPKSVIFVEDFSDVEELANYLKYLAKNETAYLEYHKWKTMKFSDEFEKKSYLSMRNMECNICKEVARQRILDEWS